jgi:transcriptional regulator with XRE-family HTH domain
MKNQRALLPGSADALAALGAQIAVARRELGWTAAQLAERLGTTRALVARIERGAPGTAIGTVFDAAVICGVPLFGAEEGELSRIAEVGRARLALLPARVRARATVIDDEF